MANLEQVMVARQTLGKMFPKLAIGISGSKENFYLSVKAKDEAEAKKIPTLLDKVKIETKIVGEIMHKKVF
jgi:hypothetical protein